MAVDERIDALSQQLSKQSLGPIDTTINATVARLASALAAFGSWLRQAAYEQPLITLFVAGQAGYLVARLGGRNARH